MTATSLDNHAVDRLIKIGAVMQTTSLGKTSIYRLMRAGMFPKAVSLTEGRVAWKESAIRKWIDERQEHELTFTEKKERETAPPIAA